MSAYPYGLIPDLDGLGAGAPGGANLAPQTMAPTPVPVNAPPGTMNGLPVAPSQPANTPPLSPMQPIQTVAGLGTQPMTWRQRVQGVAGLPTGQTMTPQQRIQALAGQGAAGPQGALSRMTPQQAAALLQRYPQLARQGQRFGVIGSNAPQGRTSLSLPPGGAPLNLMQPGGFGNAGPIAAPGSSTPLNPY